MEALWTALGIFAFGIISFPIWVTMMGVLVINHHLRQAKQDGPVNLRDWSNN